MAPRRWSVDHLEAALWLAGAVGLAVWLGAMALAGLPALWFLLVLVLAGFPTMAWRSWRRAGHRSDRPPVVRPLAETANHPLGPPSAPLPPRSAPTPLSTEGHRRLERIVAVLGAAGLLAPRVPDPRDLVEAVADAGEPVTPDTVLAALWEADYWHAGFRPDDHLDAVVLEPWKGEQLADGLRALVADLARLAGDDLAIELADLRLDDEGTTVRTRMTLVLGGRRELLDYRGAPKRFSTVVPVAVARALRATPARLAWYPHDQGVWLAVLRGGVTVETLNAELGLAGPDVWGWVDEQEPMAAGDL